MTGRDIDSALTYGIAKPFQQENLINHPKFGIGLVSDIMMPNKIEVIFEYGIKILICSPHNPVGV